MYKANAELCQVNGKFLPVLGGIVAFADPFLVVPEAVQAPLAGDQTSFVAIPELISERRQVDIFSFCCEFVAPYLRDFEVSRAPGSDCYGLGAAWLLEFNCFGKLSPDRFFEGIEEPNPSHDVDEYVATPIVLGVIGDEVEVGPCYLMGDVDLITAHQFPTDVCFKAEATLLSADIFNFDGRTNGFAGASFELYKTVFA